MIFSKIASLPFLVPLVHAACDLESIVDAADAKLPHMIFVNGAQTAANIRCDTTVTEYVEYNEAKPATSYGRFNCEDGDWSFVRENPACRLLDSCPSNEPMKEEDVGLTLMAMSRNNDGTVNQRYNLVTATNKITNYLPKLGWTIALQVSGVPKDGFVSVSNAENVAVSKNGKIISFNNAVGVNEKLPKLFSTELVLYRVPKDTLLEVEGGWQYRYRFTNTNCLDVGKGTFEVEGGEKWDGTASIPVYTNTGLKPANEATSWDSEHLSVWDSAVVFKTLREDGFRSLLEMAGR